MLPSSHSYFPLMITPQTLVVLALDYSFGRAPMERVAVISGAFLGLAVASITESE